MEVPDSTTLYKKMYLIRRTEELLNDGYSCKKFSGTVHTCIGQEATAVGVISSLRCGDSVFSNHRGHGHMLAMGVRPEKLIYEIAGSDTGQCSGLGGSQHIAAPEVGFMGSNGITGGSVPIAVGYALGRRIKGFDGVSVVFFGDGATSQGVVHEAMNMASIWKLPIIFVCENNMYAMSSSFNKFVSGNLTKRAAEGYGISSFKVDGMDVQEVYDVAHLCRNKVISTGPVFMECLTYRYEGHSKSDAQLYRTKDEVKKWKERDPLIKLGDKLDFVLKSNIEDSINKLLNGIRNDLGIHYA